MKVTKEGTWLNKPTKYCEWKEQDKNRKKEINFTISINSVGKMLWYYYFTGAY